MNKVHISYFLCFLLVCLVKSDTLMTVDFLYQATMTNSRLWNNIIGMTLNFDDIDAYMNSSTFQGYLLNSNLYGAWSNNWAIQIRMPKGYHYKCSDMTINSSEVECLREIADNETFYKQLGSFIWNTTLQPFWTYGINNQYLDWFSYDIYDNIFDMVLNIYYGSLSQGFHLEGMYQADKAVENGLRDGNYTLDNFMEEAYYWEYAVYGLVWRGPGVSQKASPQWLQSLPTYFDNVWISIFSAQCVIFENENETTIENLMSDHYTKQFISRRFTVDGTQIYTSFTDYYFSFSNIRLTDGQGVDGVTNTMAAAIWMIDFALESAKLSMYDFHFDGDMYENNKQGIMGPGPNFEPQALYYGMIFLALVIHDQPLITLPEYHPGSSQNIKVWGLKTSDKFNFIIINKDLNPNLNGIVKIEVKSKEEQKMKCIYLEAPSLDSKADEITIGGHKYQSGNSTVLGNYEPRQFPYNANISSFEIPLKFAQVAYCTSANVDNIPPTIEQCSENFLPSHLLFLMMTIIAVILH